MRILFYILICFTLLSCSDKQTKTDNEQETFQLPDSLFPFKNIKNSLVVNNFWYDKEDNYKLYADSATRTTFIHMDSIQKIKFLLPAITPEMNPDTNYFVHYMDAVFVAKQKKIGDLTPIIVWLTGDDYGALFYILLDKDLRPISHLIINGGEQGGPSERPDSTLELPPVIHSFFNGNEINWYSLTEFIRPDSIKRPSIFDSINYISKILSSGQIETKRLDSARFERMPKW